MAALASDDRPASRGRANTCGPVSGTLMQGKLRQGGGAVRSAHVRVLGGLIDGSSP